VVEVDPKQQRVQVQNLESGKQSWEPYDQLMVATGAVPFRPDVDGADADRIFGADSLKTATRIKDTLDRKQLKRAVIVGGGNAAFPGVVGTAISKICEVGVARTGLQEKEIQQLGLDYVSAKIKSKTRAGYYPEAEDITVKVLAEKGSGRLLGGQIVGRGGAAKRIDVLATALHAGFNVQEMIHLDLSYAPPFSPVWDPVLIAVRQIIKKI
jgi:NADPH-dependent 2,4-dienoyl-CoA reductase/sulfur reductase-like enzyme